MSLREEMWKYEQITGESAEHVPIIKLGAFLDGYEMGLKALEQQLRDCNSCKHSDNGKCAYTEECHECMWESKYEQQPSEDCINREPLRQKLQEHRDLFVNAFGGFKNMNYIDKARVDEIDNCIGMVVNEPSVTPQTDILDKIREEIAEKESEICSDTSENVALKVAYIEALKIIDKFR